MLAFGSTHRNPWSTAGEKLPQVDLLQLLLEIEASGRPIHRMATVRKAFGLPATNPALEQKLKDLNLWPQDALPLPVPADDVLFMLRSTERIVAYGLIMGLGPAEIAKAVDANLGPGYGRSAPASTYGYCGQIRERWIRLAEAFGLIPSPTRAPGDPLNVRDVARIFAHQSDWHITEFTRTKLCKRGWYSARSGGPCGIHPEDFPALWATAQRWEDMPTYYVHELKCSVTMDTYRYLKTNGKLSKAVS